MSNALAAQQEREAISQLIQEKEGKPNQYVPRVDKLDKEFPTSEGTLSLTQLMRNLLNANDQALAKLLVSCWYRQACFGNRTALREATARIDGPIPTEAIEE